MYVQCILRNRKTPQAPTTSSRLYGVYTAAQARTVVEQYKRTLRKVILIQATLMESASKPIRTVYNNGIWYY